MTCAACSSGIERTVLQTRRRLFLLRLADGGEHGRHLRRKQALGRRHPRGSHVARQWRVRLRQSARKKQKGLTLKLRFSCRSCCSSRDVSRDGSHDRSPRAFGLAQLRLSDRLTLAVLCINYRFFASGVMAAVKLVPNMDTLVTWARRHPFYTASPSPFRGAAGISSSNRRQ